MRTIPHGKGMFIWILKDRLLPAHMAAQDAKLAGITWVAIKAQNGTGTYNAALIGEYCQAFEDEGIEVWLWGYLLGLDGVGRNQGLMEAQRTVELCQALSPAGWIIDAEAEYKRKGTARAAEIYMTHLRTTMPDLSVALCSYRFPSVHPEFPWRSLLGGATACDFHMPQVYWMEAHNPTMQLVRSCGELKALADIPIVPVGAAFTEHGWEPTIPEINAFHDQVMRLGLPAETWWEWYFASVRRPQFWTTIKAHGWQLAPPPPLTDKAKLDSLWEHHDELHPAGG